MTFTSARAAQLRTRRERAGLSVRAVSRTAGVSHSYVSRVERGLAPVSTGQMARLEAALLRAAMRAALDRPALVDVIEELVQ
jgi:transcriptional regulator with XRE-family HTH domain